VENREIICIGCPMGCPLDVVMKNGKVVKVNGNSCKRGEVYAQKECTNPTRILTSSVGVKDGVEAVVSVKTERDIPKEKILQCMKELKNIVVKAPIHMGDIIVKNVFGTGIDIIATKEVEKI
jgi:CxxC motif-containing protein